MKPNRHRQPTCPATGKMAWRSRIDAERKAERVRARTIRHHRGATIRHQKPYLCEYCEGWHLTSKGE